MVGVNQQILQILTLHINPPPFPFTQKQTYRAGVGRVGALGSSSRHSLIPPTRTCTTPSTPPPVLHHPRPSFSWSESTIFGLAELLIHLTSSLTVDTYIQTLLLTLQPYKSVPGEQHRQAEDG